LAFLNHFFLHVTTLFIFKRLYCQPTASPLPYKILIAADEKTKEKITEIK